MKEIILVGTNHLDTKGPERLQKILELEKPDVISIVCTKRQLSRAIERQKDINKNKLALKNSVRKIKFTSFTQSQIPKLNRETLMKIFSIISFELITAKKYANKNNIKIIYADKEEYGKEYFKNFPSKKGTIHHFKMLRKEAFELSPEYFQKLIDILYRPKPIEKIKEEDPKCFLRRNKYAVKKILETKAKKILHIVGVDLIFNSSPNIYEMLKEKGANVKRLKLIDADNI
jgi:hypothetical protein